MGRLEGRTNHNRRESLGLFRLACLAGLLPKVWMDLMGDRLIRDLRVPKMNASSTMAEAADEIERLRSLITAWADSEDDLYGPTRATSVEWKRNDEACDALRKAVGR